MKMPSSLSEAIFWCIVVAAGIFLFSFIGTIFLVLLGGFFLAWLLGVPIDVTSKDGSRKRYRWFWRIS